MSQLVLLGALVAGHVMLAGQKDAISFSCSAKLALVTLLFLCLAVAFTQLALEGQAASQLELCSVLQSMILAFDTFL